MVSWLTAMHEDGVLAVPAHLSDEEAELEDSVRQLSAPVPTPPLLHPFLFIC